VLILGASGGWHMLRAAGKALSGARFIVCGRAPEARGLKELGADRYRLQAVRIL